MAFLANVPALEAGDLSGGKLFSRRKRINRIKKYVDFFLCARSFQDILIYKDGSMHLLILGGRLLFEMRQRQKECYYCKRMKTGGYTALGLNGIERLAVAVECFFPNGEQREDVVTKTFVQ